MSEEFISIVKETPQGELYIELPPELLASVGWDETTNLEWIVTDDSKILLKKADV